MKGSGSSAVKFSKINFFPAILNSKNILVKTVAKSDIIYEFRGHLEWILAILFPPNLSPLSSENHSNEMLNIILDILDESKTIKTILFGLRLLMVMINYDEEIFNCKDVISSLINVLQFRDISKHPKKVEIIL
jgi:hypothetical protein